MPKPAESYGFIFLSEPLGLCILRNRPVRLAMQSYFLVMHPEDRAVTFVGVSLLQQLSSCRVFIYTFVEHSLLNRKRERCHFIVMSKVVAGSKLFPNYDYLML